MHKATLLAALLLALGATAAAGAGINLSLNDCGTFGSVNAVPSCATNSGVAMSIVGSAIPPAGINRMVAAEGYIDVRTESGTISPWWTLDGCRSSALTFNFDFTAGPNNCVDFWAGGASGGGAISPVHAGPERFQIKLVVATAGENAITPDVENYLFKVVILRSKSAGAGSCAGCNDGACLALSKVILEQPAGVGDYTLTEPANRNWVTYNANSNLGECPGAAVPPPPSAPLAPTLATPLNQASGVAPNPLLTWNASAGASSYRVQVSTGVAFSATVVDEANITDTSFPVTSLAPSTTYFWHVSATGLGGISAYSSAWSFTTAAPPPPPAPVLLAPADGATGVSALAALSWSAAPGALSYRVQLSTDPGFASLVVNQGNITATSWAQGTLASNITYYWRVSATNTGGTGVYSPTWSFTTAGPPPPTAPAPPVLYDPPDLSMGMPTSLTLGWNPSAGAFTYRFQISTDAGFGILVADRANLATPSTSMSFLAPSTTYYWHVSASGNGGTSDYSPTWRFTTAAPSGPTAPAPPLLSFPYDQSVNLPTSLTLLWNYSSGATTYRAQVSTDPDFSVLIADRLNLTSLSTSVTLLASTTYYWHVSASSSGGTSEFSPTWSFRTAGSGPPPTPPAPLLSAPPNGATGVSPYPILSWNSSFGASTYRVQVSNSPAFVTTVLDQSSSTSSLAVQNSLAANTTYYWHVNAGNSGGTSAYSLTWSFTTGAAATPPPPPGQGYIGLTLNDCDLAGLVYRTATPNCAADTGVAMRIIGTVVPPQGLNRVVACEAYIDVQTATPTLSPWWTLDGCRSSALTFNFNFAGFTACHDFWAGQASGGGAISPLHTQPNRFQIKLVCATVGENAIAPEQEHYMFRVNITRAKTTGANACAGCSDPACFVMNRLVLNQPAGVGDYVFTAATSFNWVQYGNAGSFPDCSSAAMPVRRSSWGQVKAMFR